MSSWSRTLVCAALALGAVASPPRAVADEVLAVEHGQTEVAAGAGHVIWSRPDASGRHYRLVDWRAGTATVLALASEPSFFDADVGTDGHGRAVVVYTRCKAYMGPFDVNEVGQPPLSQQQRSCGLREAALPAPGRPAGPERTLPTHRPSGASDVLPTIDRDRVAFVRVPAVDRASRARLMTLDAHGRLSSRPGGPVGILDPQGAAYTPPGPLALDAAGGALAFSWASYRRPSPGCPSGSTFPDPLQVEVATVSARGRAGTTAVACTTSHSPGATIAGPVALSATRVWWSTTTGRIDGPLTVRRRDRRTGALAEATLPVDPAHTGLAASGQILAIALDGATLVYAHDVDAVTRIVRAPNLAFAPVG